MLEKLGSMRCAVLALSWLIILCSHLKTAAQNSNSSFTSMEKTVMSSPNASSTDMATSMTVMPTMMMSNTIITIPSISDGSISASLVPTSAVMVTSQLSVDTTMPEFVITVTTTATSPVPTIDTSTAVMKTNVVITTNIVMTSSSIIPMTTAIVITTSTPVPVPSGDIGDDSALSTGAIIGIAAGGGTGLALLVIFVIVICCCCCHYRKQHRQEGYLMSPTIQARRQDYVPRFSRSTSRDSLTGSLKSLRDSIRQKAKGKPQEPLISTPL